MNRAIVPTAREQLGWIDETYGIGKEINEWCQRIVDEADKRDRPHTEVALLDVLAESIEMASDWSLSAKRFAQAGVLTKLRAISVVLMRLQPPPQSQG